VKRKFHTRRSATWTSRTARSGSKRKRTTARRFVSRIAKGRTVPIPQVLADALVKWRDMSDNT
jgi:hypothetical protein